MVDYDDGCCLGLILVLGYASRTARSNFCATCCLFPLRNCGTLIRMYIHRPCA